MMLNRVILILLAITVTLSLPPQAPIIGIYTEDAVEGHPQTFQTYIAASYIKNIEMSGAQAIPLFYHYSKTQLADILSKINGVFLPGGEMPIDKDNQWTSNVAFIFQYATKQNDMGNPYPIWATCLSYEAALYLYSGRKDNMTVLTQVYGQRGLPGYLLPKTTNSTLLKSLNEQEFKEVTTKPGILWFHHTWSITLKTYQQSEPINKFWKLVSTSFTEDGVQFVSTVQAFNYPFFMTQYHPEKNSFQWQIDATRTYNSVSVEQKFINEFTKVARRNSNRFGSEQEWTRKSIYNYQPIYTPQDDSFTVQYIFDESKL